jgi:hypothetical protein
LTPQGFENLGFAFAAEDCKLMGRARERFAGGTEYVDVNMGDGGKCQLL